MVFFVSKVSDATQRKVQYRLKKLKKLLVVTRTTLKEGRVMDKRINVCLKTLPLLLQPYQNCSKRAKYMTHCEDRELTVLAVVNDELNDTVLQQLVKDLAFLVRTRRHDTMILCVKWALKRKEVDQLIHQMELEVDARVGKNMTLFLVLFVGVLVVGFAIGTYWTSRRTTTTTTPVTITPSPAPTSHYYVSHRRRKRHQRAAVAAAKAAADAAPAWWFLDPNNFICMVGFLVCGWILHEITKPPKLLSSLREFQRCIVIPVSRDFRNYAVYRTERLQSVVGRILHNLSTLQGKDRLHGNYQHDDHKTTTNAAAAASGKQQQQQQQDEYNRDFASMRSVVVVLQEVAKRKLRELSTSIRQTEEKVLEGLDPYSEKAYVKYLKLFEK